jgi:hypothetical protein
MAVTEAQFRSSTAFAGTIPEKDGVQDGMAFHKVHERQKKRIITAFCCISAADAHNCVHSYCIYEAYDGFFT